MLRPRRLCFFISAFVLTLYLALSAFLSDDNFEYVFYKIRYFNGVWNTSEAAEISCYYEPLLNTLPELETNVKPDTSIFFLETSCNNGPGVHLTPRQACAVESAAKMNPESDVYVLFPSPVVHNTSSPSASVEQLMTYDNIHLRHVSMDKYFKNTPLDLWHQTGQLRTSHWPRSHASDILRYLTLWKFGGIYLDLDVVVTKTLTDLVDYAGAESYEDVAAGVLSFSYSRATGRTMANMCVQDLRNDFRGYDWGHNGPGVITRALKRLCNTEDVREMTLERCKGFTVFPPHTFYAIPWRQWKLYFNASQSELTLRKVANSRAIHVWNRFSTQANITVGSAQPYGVIASQYCPRVYSSIGSIF